MSPQPIDCFGMTDRGRVREGNEDHFVIAGLRKLVTIRYTSLDHPALDDHLSGDQAYLFAVADGVGGRPGGELASSAVVEALLDYVGQASSCFNRFDVGEENAFLERLELQIRAAHEELLRRHGDSSRAPATTLTMAILVGARAYIVHVGDSRAYYLRRGKLHQLTRDQTIGEYMVNIGAWTDTQARRAPTAAALASAIGGSELSPAIGLIDLEPQDALLLCTDGLTRHLDDDVIGATVARHPTAEAAARDLIGQALAAGGEDNVTVVIARIPPA